MNHVRIAQKHCRGNAPSLVPVYFFGQYLAYEVQSVSYLLAQTEHYI